jgi:hypothetical protein
MAGQRLVLKEINKRAVIKPDKTIKRVNDGINGLMIFGENNDYPQIMERLINKSVTAKKSANIYAKFLAGQGFENEKINNVVVGTDSRGKKITLKHMLRMACISASYNKGFYIHCNPNFEGIIGSTHLKTFKNIRFAIPDDTGYSAKILYYENWEKDKNSSSGKYDKRKIKDFNVFNLDKKVLETQIQKAGSIDKYKGQVYFCFLDDSYFYPLSTYDEVYMDMDTEGEIQLFKNRQIRNGFFKKTIIRTQPEGNEEEAEEFVEEMRESLGADGEGLFIMKDDLGVDGNFSENTGFRVDQLDSNIDDKLFEGWEKTIPNNIRKAAGGLPAILIDYEQSNLGNTSGEAVREATNYYNLITDNDRVLMEEAFEEIYKNFNDPILQNNTNWKIKPLNLLEQQKDGINNISGAESNQAN